MGNNVQRTAEPYQKNTKLFTTKAQRGKVATATRNISSKAAKAAKIEIKDANSPR